MPVLPRDVSDLRLAPVVLAIGGCIEELSQFDIDQLRTRVALMSDWPDWNRELREEALLRAITQGIDTHDWAVAWHPRGVELSHGQHRVVLGVPVTFAEYVGGRYRQSVTA